MRSFIVIAFCCSIILGAAAVPVEGKLFVQSPEGMIKNTPYIIIGKIIARKTVKSGSRTVIGVEKVLKGTVPEKEIIINQRAVPIYGFASLPKPDTRVMLFLKKSDEKGYSLYADLNNVGTVDENNKVKLYKGAGTINKKSAKDYEQVYTTFLFQTYDAEKKLFAYRGKNEHVLLGVSLLIGLILITFAAFKLKRR